MLDLQKEIDELDEKAKDVRNKITMRISDIMKTIIIAIECDFKLSSELTIINDELKFIKNGSETFVLKKSKLSDGYYYSTENLDWWYVLMTNYNEANKFMKRIKSAELNKLVDILEILNGG